MMFAIEEKLDMEKKNNDEIAKVSILISCYNYIAYGKMNS
jgi:hypothetical protein